MAQKKQLLKAAGRLRAEGLVKRPVLIARGALCNLPPEGPLRWLPKLPPNLPTRLLQTRRYRFPRIRRHGYSRTRLQGALQIRQYGSPKSAARPGNEITPNPTYVTASATKAPSNPSPRAAATSAAAPDKAAATAKTAAM
jgi:hypothetical protein